MSEPGGRENGKLWRDRRGVITWWMIELQWRREMRMDGWLGVGCEKGKLEEGGFIKRAH